MSRDAFISRWLVAAICLPVVVTFAVWSVNAIGQDAKKPEKPAAKKDEKKAAKGRLPANYAKVVTEDTQKEKIYAIQAKYDEQLSKLEAEIKTLRSQRDAEVEGTLSADQKAKLQKVIAEAKAEQEAKKKANEDKKKAEAKPEEKKPADTKPADKK